jgi:hypothetical protein
MTRDDASARPRPRRPGIGRRAATGAASLTLGVSAAGGCAELWLAPAEVTVDQVAVWGPSQGAGDDALLEGRLTVDDGCVYVTDASGTRWLPVFSEDLVGWDGETLRTAGGAYVDGDAVALGGGVMVEGTTGRWAPPEGLHVPSTCVTTDVWNATR